MEKKQTGAGVSQHKRTSKKKRPDAGSHVMSSERNKNQGEKGMLNNGKKDDTNHVEKDDRSGKEKKESSCFCARYYCSSFCSDAAKGMQ